MEHHSSGGGGGNRAEAERWLLIAEKLLAGRDLVGSKTFAIRARDSEPRHEAADQILAVADTLIAGEKRINNNSDWYAILQLARHTVDPELIATNYRRLAILLNPHRNHFPFADHAMKLVSDAWSVLSNPNQKTLYDNEIVLFSQLDNQSGQENNDEQEEHHQQDAALRRSHRNNNSSRSKSKDRNVAEETENPNNNNVHDVNVNFWTACPYCYNMYEYPGVYVDCSLRCQNCRRAFHGTKIMAPPPIIEGKENYFCCWGFYPLGVSTLKLDKNKGVGSTWSPFAPMFTGPQIGEDGRNVSEGNTNVVAELTVDETFQRRGPELHPSNLANAMKSMNGEDGAPIVKKPRILCLHGFRTSGKILEKQTENWPEFVREKMDLVFIDAPFPAEGESGVAGKFDPPYYEWFQSNEDYSEYRNFEEGIAYIEDCMKKLGPFDGVLGFSQGGLISAALPGMQAEGVTLTSIPKIKSVMIIAGAKLGGSFFSAPKLAENAFSSPIECPSLHIIGEKYEIELLDCYVDPFVIYHHGGHTVPKLDEKGLEIMLKFIEKIQKLV